MNEAQRSVRREPAIAPFRKLNPAYAMAAVGTSGRSVCPAAAQTQGSEGQAHQGRR